jgi:ubiquitin carboxyl-terminal hydrolase L5
MAVVDDRIVAKELELALLQSEEKPTALLEAELQQLREERERGRLENARRRQNYIPAIVALLRGLAEQGKLEGIVKQAKEKAAAAKEAGKSRKKTAH